MVAIFARLFSNYGQLLAVVMRSDTLDGIMSEQMCVELPSGLYFGAVLLKRSLKIKWLTFWNQSRRSRVSIPTLP